MTTSIDKVIVDIHKNIDDFVNKQDNQEKITQDNVTKKESKKHGLTEKEESDNLDKKCKDIYNQMYGMPWKNISKNCKVYIINKFLENERVKKNLTSNQYQQLYTLVSNAMSLPFFKKNIIYNSDLYKITTISCLKYDNDNKKYFIDKTFMKKTTRKSKSKKKIKIEETDELQLDV